MGSQMADDIAYFMERKPGIHRHGQICNQNLASISPLRT